MWYRAEIALGERQTEDLKVPGSIPGLGKDNDPCIVNEQRAAGGYVGFLPDHFIVKNGKGERYQ